MDLPGSSWDIWGVGIFFFETSEKPNNFFCLDFIFILLCTYEYLYLYIYVCIYEYLYCVYMNICVCVHQMCAGT